MEHEPRSKGGFPSGMNSNLSSQYCQVDGLCFHRTTDPAGRRSTAPIRACQIFCLLSASKERVHRHTGWDILPLKPRKNIRGRHSGKKRLPPTLRASYKYVPGPDSEHAWLKAVQMLLGLPPY